MYNQKDIQFVGKHDYDRGKAIQYSKNNSFRTFSVNIFQWNINKKGDRLKKGKCIVRVKSFTKDTDKVFQKCESIVNDLDSNMWDGRKNVVID